MLHGKVLLSTQAHALIKHIDITLGTKDERGACCPYCQRHPRENTITGSRSPTSRLWRRKKSALSVNRWLLSQPKPVIAEEAVRGYSGRTTNLFPAVFDALEALQPGAPQVHEQGNLLLHTKVRKGDIHTRLRRRRTSSSRTCLQTDGQDHASTGT